MASVTAGSTTTCAHCGESCTTNDLMWTDKHFCCDGCKMVYQLLQKNGLCEYYSLNNNPGINQRKQVRSGKFAFLDDAEISNKLIQFKDSSQVHVNFYLPQMHCSSCLYLLEHLHQMEPAIIQSKVNFVSKEVVVVFDPSQFSIRKTAELLTAIGYEPYISLNDLKERKSKFNKALIYPLGVAGFCFANIMLLSFPEYLGLEDAEKQLQGIFRLINVLLSLPVVFFSATPFYKSGWKALRHGYLNIDAPIALATIVTFIRSMYEVTTGTGSGYFDSMTGIVFFMLIGRVLQDKTYEQLSFERDYTSYFPIAVTVLTEEGEKPTSLPNIKNGDTIKIHNEELIPADGILTRGKALIDYSFVTGESVPILKEMGEIIYAGGKQTGGAIELLVIKEVTQSYLTKLWSGDQFKETETSKRHSFVDALSRYFTVGLFSLAIGAGIYWWLNDPTKMWHVISSILIVACPCALLLSNTFTNGNILRIMGRKKMYMRNAMAIEQLSEITHIVLDKTGTITNPKEQEIHYTGKELSHNQIKQLISLAAQSSHPLSKSIVRYFGQYSPNMSVTGYQELPGKGIEGFVDNELVALGSKSYITGQNDKYDPSTQVWIAFENTAFGYFTIQNKYREGLPQLMQDLGRNYKISILSGDHSGEKNRLEKMIPKGSHLLFEQSPQDKLSYIQSLQSKGEKVMMIGDGLNDAGALKKSDIGIALTDDSNNFTPASDAILEASQLNALPQFIKLSIANKRIVWTAFIVSIIYNSIGLTIAAKGLLSPMVAAILMPASTISILLITFGLSNVAGKRLFTNHK